MIQTLVFYQRYLYFYTEFSTEIHKNGSSWEHLGLPDSARRTTDDSHQSVLKREKR